MSEKICGIYCIENIISGKKYIGQSIRVNRRWYEHKRRLNRKEHFNIHLQRSWEKYGESFFIFYVIEECNANELNKKEEFHILKNKANNLEFGFNMNKGGDHIGCDKHTKETRMKISKLQIGRKLTDEWKLNISKANKGKTPKNFNMIKDSTELRKMKVRQYTVFGDLVKIHESVNECARNLDGFPTNAVKALKGKNKTFKNFILIYDDEYSDEILRNKLNEITDKMMSRYRKIGRFY